MVDPLQASDSSSQQQPHESGRPESATLSGSVTFNVIVPLILLALGAGFIIAMGQVEPETRLADDLTRSGRLRSLPPVRVERLRSIDLEKNPLQLVVDGTVVPYREAMVAAEVAGQIVYKSEQCEAGEFVSKDQLLMKIDTTDYELEVDRLTRLQEQEYEALSEIDQELKNVQRSLEVAKEDVKIQQAEVDRRLALPEGFASRAEVDQAKSGLLQARQQLVGYENQGDLLRIRRVRLEASERLAATELKVAEVDLQRCEISAPIDGVIVTENVDLNSFVSRGNTLVTIEDTSKVEVSTNLRMDQLYWVLDQNDKTRGRQLSAAGGYRLPETPAVIEYVLTGMEEATYRWQGRLLGYDGIGLDPISRTVPVRVVVDNPRRFQNNEGVNLNSSGPTALVRGMFVRVILLIKPQTPLVVIPARALKPGNRVWQFIPDESVLDPPADAAAEETGAAEETAAAEPDRQTDEPAFDPDQWAPGRVVVRSSIIPVNALRVDLDDSTSAADSDTRMWFCEVRDRSLNGGSLVVTSPLAEVETDGMPARAAASTVSESGAAGDTTLTSRVEDE